MVVGLGDAGKTPCSFTVRLVFAEPEHIKTGERVFDVAVQGKVVLKDFDIVRDAGGPRHSLVKEFTGIEANGQLSVRLTPAAHAAVPPPDPVRHRDHRGEALKAVSIMHVTVHYFAQLHRAAGRADERVELEPGSTVTGLLARLGNLHGDAVRSMLLGADGTPRPSLLVFIDEQPADPEQQLVDDDKVTILTPMAGG